MRLAGWKTVIGCLFLITVLSAPAWPTDSDRRSAVPGTLNYVEGTASMGSQTLDDKAVGSAELQRGQVLDTGSGKAEILLTPGVFLRLGSNSAVRMISPDITNTELALNQGEAMVEVDEIHPQNDIRIDQAGVSTRLLKTGLYDFDASNHMVRVFDGRAQVLQGDRHVTVKGGHELALNELENTTGKLKAQSFDKKTVMQGDDLYRWSSLRSDYLSEANVDTARVYVADGWYGPGWFGAGWYWSPWFGAYTFLPGSGFLYSPFGWGFYSPLVAYRVPVVHGNQHFSHRFDGTRPTPAIGSGFHDHQVRSFAGGGFRGNSMGHASGFGGFHGGSFGRTGTMGR